MPITVSGTSITFNDSSVQTKAYLPVVVNTFNSSGTWSKPTDYPAGSRVYVQVWGGGGGGGCGNSTARGCGGGGGAYNEFWTTLSALSATETVTIGAGGAGRNTTGQGTTGGTSSFGAYIEAYGGSGGIGITSGSAVVGGTGGGQFSAGTGGTAGLPGLPRYGVFYRAATTGTGALPLLQFYQGDGNAPYRDSVIHGAGGANSTAPAGQSIWGGGGGGASGQAGGFSVNGGNGGNYQTAGVQPGGGGGATGTTAVSSGAGGAGRVIVTVFPT
jgi:hypothetical protein